jgi:hypothetical protein
VVTESSKHTSLPVSEHVFRAGNGLFGPSEMVLKERARVDVVDRIGNKVQANPSWDSGLRSRVPERRRRRGSISGGLTLPSFFCHLIVILHDGATA